MEAQQRGPDAEAPVGGVGLPLRGLNSDAVEIVERSEDEGLVAGAGRSRTGTRTGACRRENVLSAPGVE